MGKDEHESQMLRAIFESTSDLVFVKDLDHRFLLVNPATARLLGMPADAVIGRSDAEFFEPKSLAQMREHEDRVMASGQAEEIEDHLRFKDGSEHWYLSTKLPLRSAGTVIGLVGIGRDITDRKRTEQLLSSSQLFLASILDALSAHIAIVDDRGTVLAVNEAWREFARRHGLRMPAYGVGANYLEVTRPAVRAGDPAAQEALAGLEEVLADRRSTFRMSYPCHFDGEKRWFLLIATCFRHEGDLLVVIAHENITEQKLAEEKLRENELALARLAAIVQSSDDSIVSLSLDGLLNSWNPASERMYGYTAEEAIGLPIARIIPRPDGGSWENALARIRQGEALVAAESVGVRKDGSRFVIATTISPLRNARGEVIGASVVTKDISELKDALQEAARRSAEVETLRETNKLKDHFLSTISHEMKTPLSLINGYAELLEDVCHEDKLIQGIQEGSRRLTKHINSILDYSALLGGTLPIDRVEIGLQEVVDWAIGEMKPSFNRLGIALEVSLPPGLPPITCDPRRLMQMLTELLDNAAKFTPPGGKAGIRAYQQNGSLRIEVWDTGAGIAAEDRARIWTAFTQLDVGDALRKGGLGLGLTLVKKLIELHGGRVELTSQEGRGSVFSLVLPLGPTP